MASAWTTGAPWRSDAMDSSMRRWAICSSGGGPTAAAFAPTGAAAAVLAVASALLAGGFAAGISDARPGPPTRRPSTKNSSRHGAHDTALIVTGRPSAWLSRGGACHSSSAGTPHQSASSSTARPASAQARRLVHCRRAGALLAGIVSRAVCRRCRGRAAPQPGTAHWPRRPGQRPGSARCKTAARRSQAQTALAGRKWGRARGVARAARWQQVRGRWRRSSAQGQCQGVNNTASTARRQLHSVNSNGRFSAAGRSRPSLSTRISRTVTISRWPVISGTRSSAPSMRRRSNW